jgi:hypothetical protein
MDSTTTAATSTSTTSTTTLSIRLPSSEFPTFTVTLPTTSTTLDLLAVLPSHSPTPLDLSIPTTSIRVLILKDHGLSFQPVTSSTPLSSYSLLPTDIIYVNWRESATSTSSTLEYLTKWGHNSAAINRALNPLTPSLEWFSKDSSSFLPLHNAVDCENALTLNTLPLITALLQRFLSSPDELHALLSATTNTGYTPLHIAASSSPPSVLHLLIKLHPTSLLTTSNDGELPLTQGSHHADPSAKFILGTGAVLYSRFLAAHAAAHTSPSNRDWQHHLSSVSSRPINYLLSLAALALPPSHVLNRTPEDTAGVIAEFVGWISPSGVTENDIESLRKELEQDDDALNYLT